MNELKKAYGKAIAALIRAVMAADEEAPCAEQSRCREALAALGIDYDDFGPTVPEPPAVTVPKFGSDWTNKMTAYLYGEQGKFPGVHEWVEWLVDATPSICESWGCKDKHHRPLELILELIQDERENLDPPGSREYVSDANARVAEAVTKWVKS